MYSLSREILAFENSRPSSELESKFCAKPVQPHTTFFNGGIVATGAYIRSKPEAKPCCSCKNVEHAQRRPAAQSQRARATAREAEMGNSREAQGTTAYFRRLPTDFGKIYTHCHMNRTMPSERATSTPKRRGCEHCARKPHHATRTSFRLP